MNKPYAFSEARFRCSRYSPYTYSHVASLVPVERPGLGTLAVDKYMRVYYDPAVFDRWDIDTTCAAILHEDLHILLKTHSRAIAYLGQSMTDDQRGRWNWATDIAINQVVKAYGFSIPDDWLMPERFGFPVNLAAEEYYTLLEDLEQENPKQGQPKKGNGDQQGQTQAAGGPSGEPYDGDDHEKPEPGKGSGGSSSDGQSKPWECGPPEESGVPGMGEYDQAMVEREVAEKIEQYARSKGRGSVPGELARWAQQKLRPKVDPFKALHAAVRYAVAVTKGKGDYTWRKMPRRSPPGGLRMPASVKPIPKAIVVVDTSGSMQERDLARALGVVQQGLRSLESGNIMVMAGDTDVRTCQRVFSADSVDLIGGGGTEMSVLLAKAAELRPDAIVCVTDGLTTWPKSKLRPHIVAALTRPESSHYRVPAWITKIGLAGDDGDD